MSHDSSRMPQFEKEETVTLPKQRWINQTLTISDKRERGGNPQMYRDELTSAQMNFRGCFATHDHNTSVCSDLAHCFIGTIMDVSCGKKTGTGTPRYTVPTSVTSYCNRQ